jgi:hypothetical protein
MNQSAVSFFKLAGEINKELLEQNVPIEKVKDKLLELKKSWDAGALDECLDWRGVMNWENECHELFAKRYQPYLERLFYPECGRRGASRR